jgi:SAM-dependent methyltransferase
MRTDVYTHSYDFEEHYWWYVARRRILFDLVSRLAPARILDYGCGTGKLTAELQAAGFEITGADQSDQALHFCRARKVTSLIDLKHEQLPADHFDLIILGDVLEHVSSEEALLRSVAVALRENGKLLVTVPAYDWLWSGEDVVSQHQRRYTLPRLERALGSAGFAPVQKSYFNTLLLPLVTLAIWGQKLRPGGTVAETDLRPLPRWLNGILREVFLLEKSLLPLTPLPFGASILMLAERKPAS